MKISCQHLCKTSHYISEKLRVLLLSHIDKTWKWVVIFRQRIYVFQINNSSCHPCNGKLQLLQCFLPFQCKWQSNNVIFMPRYLSNMSTLCYTPRIALWRIQSINRKKIAFAFHTRLKPFLLNARCEKKLAKQTTSLEQNLE